MLVSILNNKPLRKGAYYLVDSPDEMSNRLMEFFKQIYASKEFICPNEVNS